MKAFPARCVAFLGTLACATIAIAAIWPSGERVRTDDRNLDGRPDVWRRYDAHGQLTEIDIDSNFDGRSDIQEYYDRGALIRRESDRNFNDQIDLVDDFDATTQERVRSIADLDYDGSADVLVLFQDGRPVFSKRASGPPARLRDVSDTSTHGSQVGSRRGGDNRLAPLDDPFRGDTSIRQAHTRPLFHAFVGLFTSGGLPASRSDAASPAIVSSRLVVRDGHLRTPSDLLSPSPRGPPLS
jgi:hypothetical protein